MKLLSIFMNLNKKSNLKKLQQALVSINCLQEPSQALSKNETISNINQAISLVFSNKSIKTVRDIDAEVIDEINNKLIEKNFSSKNQVHKLHVLLAKVKTVAKLSYDLGNEKKDRAVGPKTQNAIKLIQEKYQLEDTGELTAETYRKIESVAATQARKIVKLKANLSDLHLVHYPLSSSMANNHVKDLQKALAHLGYLIDEIEYKRPIYGKTTVLAVTAFQKAHGLDENGKVDKKTAEALNVLLKEANHALVTNHYRLRGSVRDKMWNGMANATIKIYDRSIGELTEITEKKTLKNGFFDISYKVPRDKVTGSIKSPLNLTIKCFSRSGELISTKEFDKAKVITWINFTEGPDRYRGENEFSKYQRMIKKEIESKKIIDLEESEASPDVSNLSTKTKILPEDIVRIILAHRGHKKLNTMIASATNGYDRLKNTISIEVIYAFLKLSQLPNIAGDLLPDNRSEWKEHIEHLEKVLLQSLMELERDLLSDIFEHAIASNLVSRSIRINKTAYLNKLNTTRELIKLDDTTGDKNISLRILLDNTNLPYEKYYLVSSTLLKHGDFNSDFFNDKKIIKLGEIYTQDMKTTSTIAHIINHKNIGLLQRLRNDSNRDFNNINKFNEYTDTQWQNLIRSYNVDLSGTTENEYIASIKSRLDGIFSSSALLENIKNTSALKNYQSIKGFIDSHPDYDILNTDISQYIKEHQIDLSGSGDKLANKKIISEIQILERARRIGPDAESAKALVEEGLHSSLQIYFKGKNSFKKSMKKRGVDNLKAERMYNYAESRYAAVLSLLTEFNSGLEGNSFKAIVNRSYTKAETDTYKNNKKFPDISSLFGPLDNCNCDHCQSVFSPSAYLTDILEYLDGLNAEDGGGHISALDILLSRRKDIEEIKLNCKNTKTPLPYIDLVCEILENAVCAADNLKKTYKPDALQSKKSGTILIAKPDFSEQSAYDKIKNSKFQIRGHFDYLHASTGLYLQHLNLPRYELMSLLQKNFLMKLDLNAEYFGINATETDMIVKANTDRTHLKDIYGLSKAYFDYCEKLHAQYDLYEIVNNYKTSMIPVNDFLEITQFDYPELLNFIQLETINPANNRIAIYEATDGKALDKGGLLVNHCDLSNKYVFVGKENFKKLDIINRFIRLHQYVGMDMRELDLVITIANGGKIDDSLIYILKIISMLREKLDISVEEALALCYKINDKNYTQHDLKTAEKKEIPSLHKQLFFEHEMVSLTADVKLNKESILAALRVSEKDFQLLFNSGKNTIEKLYQPILLSRQLNLRIKDLLELMKLTVDPFASIKNLMTFIDQKNKLDAMSVDINLLKYLLTSDNASPAGVRDTTLAKFIAEIRDGFPTDPESDGPEKSDELVNIVNEKISGFLGLNQQITSLLTDKLSVSTDNSTPPKQIKLIQEFIKVKTKLTTLKTKKTFALRDFTAADLGLLKAIKKPKGKNPSATDQVLHTLIQSIDTSKQDYKAMEFTLEAVGILRKWLIDDKQVSLAKKLITKLNPVKDIYMHEINRTNFTELFRALTLLDKSSKLIKLLKVEHDDAEHLLKHHNDIHQKLISFYSIPVKKTDPKIHLDHLLNMYALFDFKEQHKEPEGIDFIEAALNKNINIIPTLAKLLDIDSKTISVFTSQLYLLSSATKLDARSYQIISDCANALKVSGVSLSTLFALTNKRGQTQLSTNLKIKKAVKAKYNAETWLKAIQPVEDILREKKRRALVSYLITRSKRIDNKTITETDLFEEYLIDVNMSPCMLTSRIKQAISSVQLFVQRCLLNLEDKVKPDQDDSETSDWDHWKWMRNYRVWEANRKVFLYPENWIEPELRDDKSQFFKEFEDELMQAEVTEENVEKAFSHYLNKVDEVSNLEVCCLYEEKYDDAHILHVVGRTKSNPAIYYYRQYNMEYHVWTGWEKIETEITGDHICMTVYNRKLHIFWLLFREEPMKVKKTPMPDIESDSVDSPEPPKARVIQLAWATKQKDGWSPKLVGKPELIHPWERPFFTYNLKPRYREIDNKLMIDIYLSVSNEFNNAKFYDPETSEMTRMSNVGYDLSFKPWHSSSFTFDGSVNEVKLRGLLNNIYQNRGIQDFNQDDLISSFDFVRSLYKDRTTAMKQFNKEDRDRQISLRLPENSKLENTKILFSKALSGNSQFKTIVNGTTKIMLKKGKDPAYLVFSQQDRRFNDRGVIRPAFYQDNDYAFFMLPNYHRFVFSPFYHPFTKLFIQEFNRGGKDSLLKRTLQRFPHSVGKQMKRLNFTKEYHPTGMIRLDPELKNESIDFSMNGAYSLYNWEIFFHAPLLIANKLTQNQRFEESLNWFHTIFNPISIEKTKAPQKYWIMKVFYEHNADDYRDQRIRKVLQDPNKVLKDINAWKDNPFMPHLIARYRPVAYQRNVVMKYLNNIIEWADQLFRRDSMESINEATQLYLLAYELLGKRPQKIPPTARKDVSYKDIKDNVDKLGNFAAETTSENIFPLITTEYEGIQHKKRILPTHQLPKLHTLYFCLPSNDKLTYYWNTVEDRLFKIRNCMNIEGVVRKLPLFEPPIDPALLVKAAASGVDIGKAISGLDAGISHYRFRPMLQAANGFCQNVRSLGEKLLSALEKKDAEKLSMVRASHAIALQKEMLEIRKQQIKEAKTNIDSLKKSKKIAEDKENYYKNKTFASPLEIASMKLSENSANLGLGLGITQLIASSLTFIPDFIAGVQGFGGSPAATAVLGGGQKIAKSMSLAAQSSQFITQYMDKAASMISTIAGYQRRMEDWQFQESLANSESKQIQKQIDAAEIRHAITQKELQNQELQIKQAKVEYTYLKDKFTNEKLYNWMITQISTIYFQSYQLAFDMAKRTEACFLYELGKENDTYIKFGYWDTLKKGLLAGDQLSHDLNRLEAAYLEQNKRELEITKHISLKKYFPLALQQLKLLGNTGEISLPAGLFDLDYPGHYKRRIKSVSLTIPCVVGPYTSINGTFTISRSKIKYTDTGEYTDKLMSHSVATSHGQNDSGMFQLNLQDERFLPFEGMGAICTCALDMPIQNNQFDFSSISDVIIHMNYTAMQGSANSTKIAVDAVESELPDTGSCLLNLKHTFSNEFHKFLNPGTGQEQELIITLTREHYPFYVRQNNIKIKGIKLFVDSSITRALSVEANVSGTQLFLRDEQGKIKTNSSNDQIKTIDIPVNTSGNKDHHSGAILSMPKPSKDPSKPVVSVPKPNGLGELKLKLKLKKDNATDYQSLDTKSLNNIFIVIDFDIK